MNANIRSSECAWHQSEVKVFGRVVRGLRGWEVKKTYEKEHLYGAGKKPIDITEGNEKYEGSIKVLGFELDAMNAAAQAAGFEDIGDVPHEAIIMTIKLQKTKLDRKTMITVTGMSFSEVSNAMEQGAKMREVTLPYLAMDVNTVTL